jgi:hypothetical protein
MNKMPPEQLLRFTAKEVSKLDVEWWTSALNEVLKHQKHESEHFDAFRNTIARFVPQAAQLPFVDILLLPLDKGQKLVVMGLIDTFMDLAICSNLDTPDSHWAAIDKLFSFSTGQLQEIAGPLDGESLEQGWMQLRAAAS